MKATVITTLALVLTLCMSVAYASYIPIPDGGAFIVYKGVPFGSDIEMSVRNPPVGARVETDARTMPQLFWAERLHLLSSLAWSHWVVQGTTVGEFRAWYSDGSYDSLWLLAGVHTAEWAWDRPENAGQIEHNRAEVGFSYLTSQGSASEYEAHRYYSYLDTNPLKELSSVELVMAGEGYDDPEHWLGLGIHGLTVEGEPVPEPSTILLLTTGIGGMVAFGFRRRKKA